MLYVIKKAHSNFGKKTLQLGGRVYQVEEMKSNSPSHNPGVLLSSLRNPEVIFWLDEVNKHFKAKFVMEKL